MASCVKKQETTVLPVKSGNLSPETALNINTASAAELEKLPFVGEKLAARIIEHRARFGQFRRPEHLLLIRGMSDKRFRQISNLIKTE